MNAVSHFCVNHKAILSRFSAERKEAESASLSAKEECFGRLIEGGLRGGGAVVDTSGKPPTPPPSHHRFLLFPSRQCKMPETESEWELLATLSSDPESVESDDLQRLVHSLRISV